jgi:nucleoside-diphosphate-sugar epimerase
MIVIYGGTSFMGLALLKHLAVASDAQVMLVNRGNTYWNGESDKVIGDSSRFVKVVADRKSDTFT